MFNSPYRDLLVCSKNIYKEDSCYCYMDQCLESVRYSHIKSCGFTSLPQDVTTEAPVEEVVASNDTSAGNDTKTEYSEQELLLIYAEMFNHVRDSIINYKQTSDKFHFRQFIQQQQQPPQQQKISTFS